jgi:hypothetical protein
MKVYKGTLKALALAIRELPSLLKKNSWSSYYIDVEEPVVERLWHVTTKPWRVCLHRIQPSSQAFYHPHRHPSAVLLCKGKYEMGVGHGNPDGEPPPIFGPLTVKEWDIYQMGDPNHWHYVKAIEGPSYSIMVTGEPFQRGRVVDRPKPRPLTDEEKQRIFDFFTPEIIEKAQECLKNFDLQTTTVNLGSN